MTDIPPQSFFTPTTFIDNQGNSFLSYIAEDIPHAPAIPVNATNEVDFATFLSESITVSQRSSTRFSVDLTSRDDLILTILSLLLLLVIEAILTTILLRTYNGSVSNFGFSVKQFIELARNFQFRRLIRGKPLPRDHAPRKINLRLLLIATATLVLTFGIEVAVLWLSTPDFTEVTNRVAAFTYVETLQPDWNIIRDNAGSAANRPCVSLSIESKSTGNLEQGNTRITPCLAATGNLSTEIGFQIVSDDVDFMFETKNHLFGAEHRITIGNLSASYKMIIYFTLDDRRRKIMYKRSYYVNHEHATYFMHRQFIAYLFNEYVRRTNDTSMDLERLTALGPLYNMTLENGDDIVVAQINRQQRFRRVTSSLITTKVRGVIPRGDAALRFAVAYLKGASGLAVAGPDLNDLDIGSSSTWASERRMWLEESRRLNWLTMTILLAAALVFLLLLRRLLKPVGTAEIAGAFVSKQVGAEFGRPVGLMGRDERSTFSLVLQTRGEGTRKISDIISYYSDEDKF